MSFFRSLVLLASIGLRAHAYLLSSESEVESSVKASSHLGAWLIKRTPPHAASLVQAASAPAGTAKGLFVPAMHECDASQRAALLESNPEQAEVTTRDKSVEMGLQAVNDIFASEGVPTILESGSLLGFYRQCHAIPGDLDGDVAIFGHWLQDGRFERLVEKFKQRGGDFHKDLCPEGLEKTGCQLRVVFDDKKFFPERFHVDVFVYGESKPCSEAPCTFNTILWPGGGLNEKMEYAQCDNSPGHFEQASFLGRTFWMTVPTEDYLTRLYGKTWAKPGGGSYQHCDFDNKLHPTAHTSLLTDVAQGTFVLGLQKNATGI